MKILMTSGIFEPEAGGPATLTPKIATQLSERGWDVTVIVYSDKKHYDFDSKYPFRLIRVVRSGNRLVNYAAFFFATLRHMRGVDLTYSLDWLAAGLPVILVSMLWQKPVVIRIGGDYIWERYLESHQEPMPIIDFYEKKLQHKYPVLFTLIRFVLQKANRVVFNSDVQREIYHREYALDPAKTTVIYNPVPKAGWEGIVRGAPNTEIVFAARFIVMKNPHTLVRAFAAATLPPEYRLILIGDGPELSAVEKLVTELGISRRVDIVPGMMQKELYERVKNCRAMVLPTWTDVAPNQVFEAMQLQIPMLVSKENFLPIRTKLPETIDPRSVSNIAEKLEMLADDVRYQQFIQEWNALRFEYDWDREIAEHLTVFASVGAIEKDTKNG